MLIRFLGLAVLFAVSLHGWGLAGGRVFRMGRRGWPETIVIGLAAVVFLGGLLNLSRLALPWSLAVVVMAGTGLSLPSIGRGLAGLARGFRAPGVLRLRAPWTAIALYVPMAVVMWFTIATQLQPQSYNRYDDFQKYFAYPVRMLETGTLLGSPLSALGLQTLGGKDFLHGFVIEVLPFSYLNGLDTVFGLFLCMVLAARFAGGGLAQTGAALLCLAAVVFINPQYVNISALYLGGALIMTVILLTTSPAETGVRQAGLAPVPAAMGLLYAALVALKPTFAVFFALHLPAAAFAIAVSTRDIRNALRWGARAGLWSGVFLSPWVLLHAPHYLAALGATPPAGSGPTGGFATDTLDFLSTRRLPYGGSMAAYTGLIAATALGALLAAWAGSRSADARVRFSAGMTLAAAATGAAAYVILVAFVAPRHVGYDATVRYFTPFAIGIAPAVFGLAAFHLGRLERTVPRIAGVGLPLAVAAIPMVAFWPSVVERTRQALGTGSVLAFSALATSQGYIDYNQKVLDPSEKDYVAAVQARIPAGEPLIAWINAPFYLDFGRNPIIDVDPAGLSTPWAIVPAVHYVLWQYNGIATSPPSDYQRQAVGVGAHERLIAVRTLAFGRRLEAAVRAGDVVYNDGQTLILFLPGELPR
jgi:hypothetical protein